MTTELEDVMATPEQFVEWLSHLENDFMMKAGDTSKCPLARFLQTIDPRARVYPTGISVNEFSDELKLPCWAEEFVMLIDNTFGIMQLTPRQALWTLEEVCSLDHPITESQIED